MKKSNLETRDIAVAGILLALILVFMLVPMNVTVIDLAFIPLMAVLIAVQVEGLGMGLFTGTAFGIASLIAAFTRPNPFSVIFYNPLVSIVPRMIIPITSYFVFSAIKRLLVKRMPDSSTYFASLFSSIVGVLTNTGLVVGALALFNFGKIIGGYEIGSAFILSLLSINFIIEIGICALATPLVSIALRLALHKDSRLGRITAHVSAQNVEEDIKNSGEEL